MSRPRIHDGIIFEAPVTHLPQLRWLGYPKDLIVGTDSGAPGVVIGKAVRRELETLVQAGLSPMEAIVCGTKRAAENLGQGNELGTIETGKLADMIVVSGNPATDISDTRNIKLVMKDGKILINKLGLSKPKR